MLNLFDLTSQSFTSNAFLLERQVTVVAIGLPAGGEIQFETVYFRDTPDGNVNIDCGACADACGPGSFPTSTMAVIGTKRLSCGPCETADPCECPADEALRIAKYNVKLTSTSSYIVLDAPIGSYIRAVYIGTGLGTFHVFYSNSDTRDLTDTMRGCCPPSDSSCNSKENQMAAAPLQVNLSDTLTAIPTPTACQSNFGTTVTGKLVQFVSGYGWIASDPANGSETKITAGTNVTVSGAGTVASPYVIASTGAGGGGGPTADGSETKITPGTNIASITGLGTVASPYVINAVAQSGGTAVDGSETKVNAGNNITVTGAGTAGNPYVINGATPATAPDGSETKVTAGAGVTLTGTGTTVNPYVVANTVAAAAAANAQVGLANDPAAIPAPTGILSDWGSTILGETVHYIPGIGWRVVANKYHVTTNYTLPTAVTGGAVARGTFTCHRAGIVAASMYVGAASAGAAGSAIAAGLGITALAGIARGGQDVSLSTVANNAMHAVCEFTFSVVPGDVISAVSFHEQTQTGLSFCRSTISYVD